jgi:hypothetical protein
MEMSMRTTFVAALLASALALPFAGSASAQRINEDVMTRCNQTVGQMKFEGWPGDRNREMMMLACHHNNGVIPGSQQQQQPAALSQQHGGAIAGNQQQQRPAALHRKPERQRAAPGG